MKYLKTFESMKDIYGGEEFGSPDSCYFVVTNNEEFIVRVPDFDHFGKTSNDSFTRMGFESKRVLLEQTNKKDLLGRGNSTSFIYSYKIGRAHV